MNNRNRNKKLNIAIWMTLVVTVLLLLLTGGVLAMRYGGFMPSDADVIFLIPRKPDLSTEDDQVDWANTDSVEIFKTEQKNEDGEVIVQSSKNDSIIAPGMTGHYTFYLRNEGNVALDYKVSFKAKLLAKNILTSSENFPLLFRIYNQSGDYTVGGDDKWVTVDEINDVLDDGVVGKNAFYHYTLEWFWPFENGDDGMDTYFGDLSDEREVVLKLDISSYAEESMNPDATGGEASDGKPAPDVGEINPWLFWPLIVITALSLILLIYLIYQRFVKKRKYPQNLKGLAIVMTGVGSALSVMYLKMFRKKKKK